MAENVVYTISMQDLLSSKLKDAEGNAVKLDNKMGDLQGTAKKVGAAFVAAFAADKIMEFGGKVINVLSEFEKYDAVLTNTLGSKSEAQSAMKQITEFASKTPFQVNELTGSYVKLANMGFKPTMQQMTALGDVAASTGKGFDQLAEAVIDAQTGEFERLKEFGIRASKDGDKVTFMFKGQQTQVANTDAAIRDYLVGLGQAQGVTGAMAAISETTGGQISNLEDSMDQLYLTIGKALKPVITEVVSALSWFFNTIKDNLDTIIAVAGVIAGGAVAFGLYSLAMNTATIGTGLWTAAQWLLNAALTANPIGLVVTAIGALVAAIVIAWNKSVGFRAGVMGLWGTLKEFGSIVIDVFKGVWDIIQGVFTFNPAQIATGYAKAADAMANAGTRMATAYKEGFDKVMAEDAAEKAKIAEEEKKVAPAMKPKASSATAKGKEKDKKEKSVAPTGASGSKSVTINISIGKLIDSFKVQTNTMVEGTARVKEMVAQTLLGAINDSQITAGI